MVGESGDLCGSSTVGVPGGLSLAQTRPPGGEEGGAVRGGEGGVERGSESSGVTSSSGVSHTVPLLESLLRIPESGLPQRELSPLFLLSDPLWSSPSTVTCRHALERGAWVEPRVVESFLGNIKKENLFNKIKL